MLQIARRVLRRISIVIMIFVNYGGGGYSFFNHSRWNGLTVADLVFPWFVLRRNGTWRGALCTEHTSLHRFMYIMGTSMALSFASLHAKGTSVSSMLYKVVRRSVILFCLGMFVVNAPGTLA